MGGGSYSREWSDAIEIADSTNYKYDNNNNIISKYAQYENKNDDLKKLIKEFLKFRIETKSCRITDTKYKTFIDIIRQLLEKLKEIDEKQVEIMQKKYEELIKGYSSMSKGQGCDELNIKYINLMEVYSRK